MNYNLTDITQQELQIILAGIGELPMKVGLNIFGKIQQQIAKQDKEKAIPIESLDSGVANDSDINHSLTGQI